MTLPIMRCYLPRFSDTCRLVASLVKWSIHGNCSSIHDYYFYV